ncbi:MAG: hypothetical protein F4242_09815 [Acidimicrobiales bacterium]|nr:hypothetical protein [Acidimicrobiales bacterium]MYD83657.1 hypothetical protein [Acidimicrobiales bacterium]
MSHTLFEVLEADTEYRAYIMGAYQYCGDDVNCTDTHEGRIHTVSDATRESAIITFRTPRSRPLFAPATPGTVRQMIRDCPIFCVSGCGGGCYYGVGCQSDGVGGADAALVAFTLPGQQCWCALMNRDESVLDADG